MPFKLEAFQNPYLAPDQDRVDAILSVTAGDQGTAAPRPLVLGFIVDCSGSMKGDRIEAVRRAAARAIDLLDSSATFFVVSFNHEARVLCAPEPATASAKGNAVRRLASLRADGGTALSTGLQSARMLFAPYPDAIRQAIFLTDGKNEHEPPGAVHAELSYCAGIFQCDCWGVGSDWQVGEVQAIARGLLGKAFIIPDSGGIEAAFRMAVQAAQAKSVRDVRVRLWTPAGADILYFKQVNPSIEDLSYRALPVSAQVRDYPTGAWAAGESRDFHLALRVRRGAAGDEMLASRPSVVYEAIEGSIWNEREDRAPDARVFAIWTADSTLSSRIDNQIAHYTGQDQLAQAIQQGLEAQQHGQEAIATELLGRAVRLAHESGNAETTERLRKVVDIVDPAEGTVRLRRNVSREASIELQLESTTTRRVRK